MAPIAELDFITIFDGQIFEADQFVLLDIYESHLVWEGNYQMLTRRMEG